MMRKIISTLILIVFSLHGLLAQISEGGIPYTYDQNIISRLEGNGLKSGRLSDFGLVLPAIDNDSLANIADTRALKQGYYKGKYFGKVIKQKLDIINDGEYTELEDGTRIWLLKIHSPTAFGMQFFFEKFMIPKGGKLFIYNEDKSMQLGAFSDKNCRSNLKFGTQPILGNTVFIEYSEFPTCKSEGIIEIGEIVHVFNESVYQGPWAGNYDNSCLVNVSCSLGTGWEKEAKSVCLILAKDRNSEWVSLCTGTLLNNNGTSSRRPLILTARHCGDGMRGLNLTTEVMDWVFMFNHQTSDCNDDGASIPKKISTNSVYGCHALDQSSDTDLDYLLLETYASKTQIERFNVAYAGWDSREANGATSFGAYSIHHISGDVKKISKDNGYPVSENQYWRLTFDQGTVHYGSSGAPVFNNQHRIIGIVHGAKNIPPASACDDPDHEILAPKFSQMFSSSTSFQNLLGVYGGYCDTDEGPIYNHCYNGIKDFDETGIDCGGSCPDCSEDTPSCENGIKDGTEKGIDCGGSACWPCDIFCSHNVVTYTSSNIRDTTKAISKITSNGSVVIENRSVLFQAGDDIILKPGFRVKSGASFSARIGSCVCLQDIKTQVVPMFFQGGENMYMYTAGASRYSVEVINRWGRTVYRGSGDITGPKTHVWDGKTNGGTLVSPGQYFYLMKLYSDCFNTSFDFHGNVAVFRLKSATIPQDSSLVYFSSEAENELITLSEKSVEINGSSSVSVYPNPATDDVIVDLGNDYRNVVEIQLINSSGQLILNEECGTQSMTYINISDLASGLYFVKIFKKSGITVKKVMKK